MINMNIYKYLCAECQINNAEKKATCVDFYHFNGRKLRNNQTGQEIMKNLFGLKSRAGKER